MLLSGEALVVGLIDYFIRIKSIKYGGVKVWQVRNGICLFQSTSNNYCERIKNKIINSWFSETH